MVCDVVCDVSECACIIGCVFVCAREHVTRGGVVYKCVCVSTLTATSSAGLDIKYYPERPLSHGTEEERSGDQEGREERRSDGKRRVVREEKREREGRMDAPSLALSFSLSIASCVFDCVYVRPCAHRHLSLRLFLVVPHSAGTALGPLHPHPCVWW